MRCDHARERIGALLDGELSGRQRQDIAEHAETCPACARYRDELKALSAQLSVAREGAPRGLARRIQARLAVEQSEAVDVETPRPAPASMPAVIAAMATGWRPALRQIAVVLVACVISASATWWQMQSVDTQRGLTHDVLAAHVRSLLQENTVQVASNNTHNVKPWFAGRLEFTPVVKDLSAEGFALVGGRVDYVAGRRVAALVYRKGQHQINVFTWPGGDAAPVKFDTAQGYNVASWTRDGMAFWAISDVNLSELRQLPPLL